VSKVLKGEEAYKAIMSKGFGYIKKDTLERAKEIENLKYDTGEYVGVQSEYYFEVVPRYGDGFLPCIYEGDYDPENAYEVMIGLEGCILEVDNSGKCLIIGYEES